MTLSSSTLASSTLVSSTPASPTSAPSTLALHERRFQTVVVGGLVTAFAIVALSPHTERALFEEGRLPAAFTAVATNPVVPLLPRFGTMEPRSFARAFRTGRPVGAPPATRTVLSGLVPPAAPVTPAPFLAPADGVAPPLVADAGGLTPPSDGGGFQQTSFTPGTGIIGTGIGGGGGGGTGTTPTNPDPVSPIPEPTSWIMLLSGMTLIGAISRYRRRRSVPAT